MRGSALRATARACVWVGYPKAELPLYGIEGWSAVFGARCGDDLNRFMWRR